MTRQVHSGERTSILSIGDMVSMYHSCTPKMDMDIAFFVVLSGSNEYSVFCVLHPCTMGHSDWLSDVLLPLFLFFEIETKESRLLTC